MDAQAWKTTAIVLAVVLPLFMIALAFFIWRDHHNSKANTQQQSKWHDWVRMNTIPSPPGHYTQQSALEDGSRDQHQGPRVEHIPPPPRAQLQGHGNLESGNLGQQQQPNREQRGDTPRQSRRRPRGDEDSPSTSNEDDEEDNQEESSRDGGQRSETPPRVKRHGKGKHRAKK